MYTPNLELWAYAVVDAAGAIVSRSHNVASVTFGGAGTGDYIVKLASTAGGQLSDWGVDATERAVIVSIADSAKKSGVIFDEGAATTNDTDLQVFTLDETGAVADRGFSILVLRKRP